MCYNCVVQIKGVYKIMEKLKLTLENVQKVKNETKNKLTKYVCDYIIKRWNDYDDKKDILLDVINCGCESGVCRDLVFNEQTKRFYETYKHEINKLVYMSDYDNLADLFGDRWDPYDPLALEEDNQNLLAWFGFEETITNIAYKFGIE